ncbi:uncharacterized protein BT62DRAFT_915290 [Guyanagaster necrorhizus]|uniref:Uncharacterized protein n=1 Tax=Guyanagaster necrorhizus TaxID=856835 RepID=A0A9P8AYR7_9AGAR|nr:uncharacterized protein BT62DRAFT_915290 [Guyanagaster necrorhizus MCA 3950]KAG7452928.1 hypothetical protein BT62DRAFT_915290 [Guyanagaster necrorhizus MCA 3950]
MASRLFTVFATASALFGAVFADLQVTAPSSDIWWVAQSTNVIAWTCNDSPYSEFTILITNSDSSILTSALAIVAIEQNYDCSKILTPEQVNMPAATGYTLQLANPLNSSQVYAASDLFEIKALGSAYPSSSAAVESATGSLASASASAASASASASASGNAGSALKTSFGFGLGAIGAILGLVTV